MGHMRRLPIALKQGWQTEVVRERRAKDVNSRHNLRHFKCPTTLDRRWPKRVGSALLMSPKMHVLSLNYNNLLMSKLHGICV